MDLSILPDEIKSHIISFIPMYKLITDNPPAIINEYILYYIDTQLLKDNYIAGCLYESNIYYKDVCIKVNEISLKMAKLFMKETDKIGGLVHRVNTDSQIISFEIIFKFTTIGKYCNGSKNDIKFSLTNYLINRGQCTGFYLDTTYGIDYNEKSITEDICRILFKNMYSGDTTIDIKSIQMIKHQLNTKTLIKIPKFI
jgi:hypothetical protein